MAILCFNSLPSFSSSSCSSSLSRLQSPAMTSPVSRWRFGIKPFIDKQAKSFSGVSLQAPFIPANGRAAAMIVKSAADVDGTVGSKSSNEEQKVLPVDELQLESKEQQKIEQRMRMKLAKKIRLRRKRLLRKRKMRKKGRWPPSKMKKLKNV